MTYSQINQLFQHRYDAAKWKEFLNAIFGNVQFFQQPQPLPAVDTQLATQAHTLGYVNINEHGIEYNIGVYEVMIAKGVVLERNRVGLRNLLRQYWKDIAGAFIVFYTPEHNKWRFSYTAQIMTYDAEKEHFIKTQTEPKRYTYILGEGESTRTAAQRFETLAKKQAKNITLADIQEAFSVEKLSKAFFDAYKKHYEDLVADLTGKRYIKKGNKFVEETVSPPNWQFTTFFDKDEKQARDFCKRMLGRLVFLYFIQKKGWLAVPPGKNWGEGNPDYLFQLFQETKDKKQFYSEKLVPLFFKTLNKIESENPTNKPRFPYLNGGLFDHSQDKKRDDLLLPETIFTELFNTFNNYNFTIYEDDPYEHLVAVDPEMLGHIFENLLEDNKDKGAFYTPKEIVHYMCKESLLEYLYTYTQADETFKEKIRRYADNYDVSVFGKDELKQLDRALEDVKICDPAIGSGAFPMGLLHEIYHLKLPIENQKRNRKTPADLKKHIIEQSIYGIDSDPGAVDIARLRFWLSLVVEEDTPQPLPNLDFKIVCADSLISLGNTKADLGGSQEIVQEIKLIREQYFNANQQAKQQLAQQYKALQKQLFKTAKDWAANKDDLDTYTKIAEFDPFEQKTCSWFDAWWMFGIKEGFDIVIGNPPYIQLQKNSGKLAESYQKQGYQTFERTGDIYSLFYEKGWQLLKPGGILCFITSNKWMRAGYGESTRKFFAQQTNPLLLIDFAGQKIFESATVDVNILLFSKAENRHQTRAVTVTENALANLHLFVKEQAKSMRFATQDSWIILSPIEQSIKEKIERFGTPLKDWNINIYRGILTGCNEAFIIDGKKRAELIAQDPKSAEIIRPILRGRDIKRYGYDFADLYLIATHNGIKEKGIKPVNINHYPAVKKHLDIFWQAIEKRDDQGDTPYNLRSCAYWEDFFRPKIMYSEIVREPQFYLDNDSEFFPEATVFIMTGEHLEFLYHVLHTKAITYFFKTFYAGGGLGKEAFRYKKAFLELLPIPKPPIKWDKTTIEKEILSLYQLSDEEIAFIESQ